MRKSIFLPTFSDTDTPGTDAHLVRTSPLAPAVTLPSQTLYLSLTAEHALSSTSEPFLSRLGTLRAFSRHMFGVGAASPPRIRLSLGSVPAVSCRSPCPCVSRLPALSVDGASQNVQVARRPSVCRGNWLPVELFPGKGALFTPSMHARLVF